MTYYITFRVIQGKLSNWGSTLLENDGEFKTVKEVEEGLKKDLNAEYLFIVSMLKNEL